MDEFVQTPRAITPSAAVGVMGVYAIYQRVTRRYYVGSSTDVGQRLFRHLADLKNGRHHSKKLQAAWKAGAGSLSYFLLERMSVATDLRDREQHWIETLDAYGNGFNSKSVADGPEPSLAFHIDQARKVEWPIIYAKVAPKPITPEPNDSDRKAFDADLLVILRRKLALMFGTGFLLWIGQTFPNLQFLWIALIFIGPVVLFQWPPSVKTRAAARARAQYNAADFKARAACDEQIILALGRRLGIPVTTVRKYYELTPFIIARRERLREKYRRLRSIRY